MPRQTVTLIKADNNVIVMEGVIGRDFRLSIPKSVRSLVDVEAKVRVTIEKI
jgi:hypothetical protein